MARTLIALILVSAFFTGLGALGWYFVKKQIENKPEYRLNTEKIIITPPPDWVPDQFVEEVLRTSGLNRVTLLDKTLPQKLAEAFVAYPWVERVDQVVLRHPSGADIKLSYRVPAALVEIPQRGFLPVDRNGIVLPPEYLTEETISDRRSKHLLIQGIRTLPLGSVGMPWGDPQVQTAAQLAEALTDIAEHLKLARIIPTTEAVPSGTRIVCQLQTAAGTSFHWGTFIPDDPKVEAKKKKLWNLHEQFRSLDNVPEGFRDLSRE